LFKFFPRRQQIQQYVVYVKFIVFPADDLQKEPNKEIYVR